MTLIRANGRVSLREKWWWQWILICFFFFCSYFNEVNLKWPRSGVFDHFRMRTSNSKCYKIFREAHVSRVANVLILSTRITFKTCENPRIRVFFFTLFRCPSKQNQIHFFIEKKWKRFSERKIYIHILSTLNSQHSTMYFIYKFVYKQCIDCCVWFSFVDLSAENLFLIFFFRFFFKLVHGLFRTLCIFDYGRTRRPPINSRYTIHKTSMQRNAKTFCFHYLFMCLRGVAHNCRQRISLVILKKKKKKKTLSNALHTMLYEVHV